MGSLTLSIPQIGSPNSTEDPKIATDLTEIQTWTTDIDKTNLATNSGIVKLPTLANRVLNAGTGSVTFVMGTNVSLAGGCAIASAPIAHGLGVTPVAVIVSPFAGSTLDQDYTLAAGNLDSTNFVVQGYREVNASGTLSFYWIAFG